MVPMVMKAIVAPLAFTASLTTAVVDTGEIVVASLSSSLSGVSTANTRANDAWAVADAKDGTLVEAKEKAEVMPLDEPVKFK